MVYIFIAAFSCCMIANVAAYKGRYLQKQEKMILLIMIIALAGIGACVEPKQTYDLFRHYEAIDRIRSSSFSIQSFLTEGYKITDYNYRYTYVYNLLIYIIARFFPNQVLPFITIIITYGVLIYIILREFNKEYLTNRNIVISLAIFSVILPFLYVYSSIRNALAGAVVAYGLYRLYKDRKTVIFIISTLVAILIHPIAMAVIPFVFLSRIKPGIKGIIVTLVAPSLIFTIMEYFRLKLGNDFLFRISVKYYNYTLVREDNQGRVFLYSSIVILIVLSVLSLFSRRREKQGLGEKKYSMLNLIIWYSMFSLGYFRNYEMITRLPYSIAFLSPVIVNTLFNQKEMNSSSAKFAYIGSEGVIFTLALLGLYENIVWLM